ncbi:MAG: transposase [Phycisphaerales bacterium]|nr:transposase [Phycisphaerales bacterium]
MARIGVRMRRFEEPNHARFLTFSCSGRLPLLADRLAKDCLVSELAAARARFRCHLYGWVAMPEHVHLLVWPCLPHHPVPEVLHAIKRRVAQKVCEEWKRNEDRRLETIATETGHRFWQRGGGYDRNIFSDQEFAEKLNYMHRNPVERGLADRPEDWEWSSARWYAKLPSVLELDPLPPRRPQLPADAEAGESGGRL